MKGRKSSLSPVLDGPTPPPKSENSEWVMNLRQFPSAHFEHSERGGVRRYPSWSPGASLEDALDWVDRNQIARRNLTDAQFAVVIGRIYEREKKAVGRPEKCAQNEHISQRTAEKIAAEFGVSEKTVRNAAEFAKAVDFVQQKAPEVAEKILLARG